MKPINRLLLAFILLCAAIAASQTARDSARDRAAITELEQQWLQSEHDATLLERILASDFVHVVPFDHLLTKQEHI